MKRTKYLDVFSNVFQRGRAELRGTGERAQTPEGDSLYLGHKSPGNSAVFTATATAATAGHQHPLGQR